MRKDSLFFFGKIKGTFCQGETIVSDKSNTVNAATPEFILGKKVKCNLVSQLSQALIFLSAFEENAGTLKVKRPDAFVKKNEVSSIITSRSFVQNY